MHTLGFFELFGSPVHWLFLTFVVLLFMAIVTEVTKKSGRRPHA